MIPLRLAAAISLGWFGRSAAASPPSSIFDVADTVIIGEPSGPRQVEGRRWIVDIAVQDVLKGSLTNGSTIRGVDTGQTGGHMGPGRRGVFFLRGGPVSGFALVRPTRISGSIETAYYVTPIRAVPPPASGAGVARVLFEVNEALKAPILDETRLILYMGVFELCGDPVADTAIIDLRRSPEPGNRAVAAAMGLCRGFPESANEILREPGVLFGSAGAVQLGRALGRIESYSPRLLALFNHIITATDPAIRAAVPHVALSLMKVHSREAVPLMVQLLDDDREIVRAHVLNGLSKFVDGYPVATAKAVASMEAITGRRRTEFATAETDLFNAATKRVPKEDHAQYVAAWKRWWAQNRSRLGQ